MAAATPSPPTTGWREAFSLESALLGNVIIGPDGFVATGCRTGEGGLCSQAIAVRSADGAAWTVTDFEMNLAFWAPSLQLVEGRLFAFAYGYYGDGRGGASVSTSTDGVSWSPVESASFRDRSVQSIIDTPVGTFAFGYDAPMESDNTGGFMVWPVRADGTFGKLADIEVPKGPALVADVIWTEEEFLGWGGQDGPYGGPAILLASPDAKSWKVRGSIPGQETSIDDVVALGDRLVAVGNVGRSFPLTPRAWTSDDGGRSWSDAALDVIDARMSIIEAVDGELIARGLAPSEDSTNIVSWASEDGSAWTALPDDQDMPAVPLFGALTQANLDGLVCTAGTISFEEDARGAIFCR